MHISMIGGDRIKPVNIIMYYPQTEDKKQELAKRVAEVHANAVFRRINALNLTVTQKQQLHDAIANSARQRSSEKER